MDNRFEYYWRMSLHRSRLRYKLIVSVLIHVVLIAVVFGYFNWRPAQKPPEVFEVQLVQTSKKVSDVPTEKVVEAPVPEPAPEPEPTPVVETPPSPKPKPVTKPAPPKEDPAKRVLEEKARKKKEQAAKEKKEREEKEKLEKERKEREKKEKAAREKKEREKKEREKKKKLEAERKKKEKMELERLAKLKAEAAQGVVADQLPTGLNGWARTVKRKVDHAWSIPAGIRLAEEGETIRVEFWVTSAGEIFDGPRILEGTTQPALDASCINAIKAASPLPPFPDGVREPEQYVVYVFKAVR